MPGATEERPRLPFAVVGIGASAGGLESAIQFFEAMPADSGMAFVLVQHLPPDRDTLIDEILSKKTSMTVRKAEDGMPVEPNHVYVIRPGRTLTIQGGRLRLGEPVSRPMHTRPIDDFFKSLAEEQRELAIAIILSGMGSDGAAGAQATKAVGGLCIAQEPESAAFPSMPRHLIDAGYADSILKPADIPETLLAYTGHPYARDGEKLVDRALQKEQQYVREILAVLRTRTRHDFNGYKKPTLLRRIQRRMGLSRVTKLSDYARILRQTPVEVAALADDLLIHVTGFFRDPEAWEALRQQVIVPLVQAREPGASIRCWVAACASGEEAYSLAILLVEEAEKIGKPLDIKIFATDTADRTLQNARHGIYPGGIEVDVSPERLERFFQRDDSVYRVRQELRERVIFAPQNILRDPPFSRLDIITCRNLLIYLEQELQQRLLALVHFGLREGGILFLGTSETALGVEGLFEVVDKKSKIFRRIGPTRHGVVHFTLPGARPVAEAAGNDSRTAAPRPTVAEVTTRALLEHHTPAAVSVDRELRILYFHGDTSPYLHQPAGEPTRDLMRVVRDPIRGALRTAMHRAIGTGELSPDVVSESVWIEGEAGTREQVLVKVSPLRQTTSGECLIVSFQSFVAPAPADVTGAAEASSEESTEELRRMRDELQNTIEQLQTSNEELKAAHEEVVNTNEELQSANEELETSREEMQSLHEELSTVNSQLQSKVEEYQAVSADLASLLTSTDLAVLFLDTRFRIRRFTPSVTALLDVIATDVGRPLSDLARKFDDPNLLADATQVLECLESSEREVANDAGRWFLRRITAYRTPEHRIDGVVISFIEITARRRAEEALRRSEEQIRRAIEDAPIPVILQADDGEVLQLSSAWTAATGYTIRDIPATDVWLNLVDEAAASVLATSLRSLFAGTVKTVEIEMQVRTKQGQRRYWAFTASSPSALPDGRRISVGMAVDITERKRIEAELLASKEAVEAASQMKDQFLANVSHELRTPLSVILMWSKLLDAGDLSEPERREAVSAIVRSAEAQRRLIEDLLDTTRIASGKLRVVLKPVDFADVVRTSAEAIRPLALARGVELDVRIEETTGQVLGDEDRLEQVVWILLHNAVKFSPAGTSVGVALRHEDDALVLAVSDSGKGIAPDFLPRLFQPFIQAEEGQASSQTGLGLGLSIARSLVQLHNGALTASSPGEGRGATFTVRIPVLQADVARAVSAAAVPRQRRLDGLVVYVIEDHADAREAVRNTLEHAGAVVTAFARAEDALARVCEEPPQVILSDIGLPGASGLDLVRAVRSREERESLARVKVLAITAMVTRSDREAARASGFDGFLAKPVDPETMISTIRRVLGIDDA